MIIPAVTLTATAYVRTHARARVIQYIKRKLITTFKSLVS